MDIKKLEKLGFEVLKDNIENVKYKNKKVDEYQYYGRDKRPDFTVALSQIKLSEATSKNYIFLGLCCDKYGNKGFLFNDLRANPIEIIKQKIKDF